MLKNEITIIAPCFNEEKNIDEFYSRIISQLDKLQIQNYKIIFIDDGSIDNSWDKIFRLTKFNKKVNGIQLSRNFGHQNAILSSLKYINSKYTMFIDTDLQDPPELLPKMYTKIKDEKINMVYGKRIRNNENFFKKIFSKFFYYLFNYFSDTKIPRNVSDFRIIDEKVLTNLIKFEEQDPFIRGLISWVGFQSSSVEFIREKRKKGNSGWSNKKMINFSISAFMGFSTFPL